MANNESVEKFITVVLVSLIFLIVVWVRLSFDDNMPRAPNSNYNVDTRHWKSIMKNGVTCPKALLRRVGSPTDGGKWTCGLSNLTKLPRNYSELPCVVSSFGVGGDSSFKAEVLQKSKCDVFAYDPTVEKMRHQVDLTDNSRVHFKSLGIAAEDTDRTRTLKTLMKENRHVWIDILKMDIEGEEYSSFARIFEDFNGMELPFGQVLSYLIELHIHEWKSDSELEKEDKKKVRRFLKVQKGKGFRMFYSELNPGNPFCCSEFSFANLKEFPLSRWLGIRGVNNSNYQISSTQTQPKKRIIVNHK